MNTVGIRELKTHLSRHLGQVRSGSRLLVTERGRVIASIDPIESRDQVEWARALVVAGEAPSGRGQTRGLPAACSSKHGPHRVCSGPRGSAVTLYLDTSSLVKLYVAEPGSDVVRRLVTQATIVATSRIGVP